MQVTSELDGAVAKLREARDAAAKGARRSVALGRAARPALAAVLAENGGAVLWMLEREGDAGAVAAHPRTSEGPVSVTELLEEDHRRLDALAEGMFAAARDGRDATALASAFTEGLARHIRIEEEVLFPVFEARTGMTRGPTTVMRMEHRAIEQQLANVREAVARLAAAPGDKDALTDLEDARAMLVGILEAHNAKEENVLYPMTDRVLPGAERDDVVRRIVLY